MSKSPGTLYRRALRRVDRRAATFRSRRPLAYIGTEHQNHCADCARSYALIGEAVRTCNALFYRSSDARGLLTYGPRP